MGLAMLTGRESGLTEASRAISGGKGNVSDLDVELKGLDASSKNEKNKAALAETLRKRAVDRFERTIKTRKSAKEIMELQRKVNKAGTDAAIKIWEGLDFMGKNAMLGLTDPDDIKALMADPEKYAARIKKALASLRPNRPD